MSILYLHKCVNINLTNTCQCNILSCGELSKISCKFIFWSDKSRWIFSVLVYNFPKFWKATRTPGPIPFGTNVASVSYIYHIPNIPLYFYLIFDPQNCPSHGTEYIAFKCRYCCSLAVYFCFGSTHLVLVNSHLFPLPCGAGNAVPREGFDLSVIILASLLVFPMLGCRHSLLRLLAIFHVFVKWNAHFQTFLLVNTCQSGVIT